MSLQTLNWDCQVRAACTRALVSWGWFIPVVDCLLRLLLCKITLRALSFGVVSSPALDLNWRETSIRFSVWLEHAWALGILLSLWMRLLLSFPVNAWDKVLHPGYFVYLLPFLTLCIATVLISQGESPSVPSYTRYRDLFARGFVTFQQAYCIP